MKINFISLFIILVITGVSNACDCIMKPIADDIRSVNVIILGKAVKMLDTLKEHDGLFLFKDTVAQNKFWQNRSYRIKLKIQNSYKGHLIEGDTIELGSTFTNCDMIFEYNNNYLLFLYKKGNKYFIQHCSYSGTIQESADNIKTVEKITKYKHKKK